MDIYFSDLSEVPLPPLEVRIREIDVEPYPDRKRLLLKLNLTPFQKPPSSEIVVTDLMGDLVAMVNFVEIIDPKMNFTLHLRTSNLQGPFTARIQLFYTENLEDITEGDQITAHPARQIVDEKEIQFSIQE